MYLYIYISHSIPTIFQMISPLYPHYIPTISELDPNRVDGQRYPHDSKVKIPTCTLVALRLEQKSQTLAIIRLLFVNPLESVRYYC
jgi:hypothetical protein